MYHVLLLFVKWIIVDPRPLSTETIGKFHIRIICYDSIRGMPLPGCANPVSLICKLLTKFKYEKRVSRFKSFKKVTICIDNS